MSDYIVNPVVKYTVRMPFDSFAELKSWSEDMQKCRSAVYNPVSDPFACFRQNEIIKYREFVSICYPSAVIVFEMD